MDESFAQVEQKLSSIDTRALQRHPWPDVNAAHRVKSDMRMDKPILFASKNDSPRFHHDPDRLIGVIRE